MHRHRDFDLVSLLPFALDADKSILLITIGIKTNTLHGEVITPRWFTNLQGEDTFSLSYFYLRCFSVWESGLLTNHHLTFLPIQLGSHEEIHIQCIILRLHTFIVRPDKLSILSVVFHACSHATPHCLIRGRIVAVMARTGGSEIDIATMLRMLGRKDMVEHRSLVKIAIHAIVLHSVQILGKLQHIIRIARLRTIDIVDIVYAIFLSREVLTTTVSAQSQRTLTCHNFPEILAGIVVLYIMSQLSDALIADNLRNLRIGMHIVKTILAILHRSKQLFVGEAAGTTQIFRIIGHGIGISKHFVHASMLVAEHFLHLFIAQITCYVHCPIAEPQKEFFCLFISAIEPCITKTCIHLVNIIERCPCSEVRSEITFTESSPHLGTIRDTTDIVMAPGFMALIVGIKYQLEFGYHIFHALAAFLIACSRIDGKSRQIMSAYMSVQSIPVGIRRFARLQACLLAVRGQHAVAIIFQEHLHVQVASMLQWSVQKGDVAQRELILIKFILRHNTQGWRYAQQSNH